MADPSTETTPEKGSKSNDFMKKHKTAIIVAGVAVVLVLVMLIMHHSSGTSSSASTLSSAGSQVPYGYNPYGIVSPAQGSSFVTSSSVTTIQGPPGPTGPRGPRGHPGPPGKSGNPQHHVGQHNSFYTVRSGDSLASIAHAHHRTVGALERLNPWIAKNPTRHIHPGRRILISR